MSLLEDGDKEEGHPNHHEGAVELEVQPARADVVQPGEDPLQTQHNGQTVVEGHVTVEPGVAVAPGPGDKNGDVKRNASDDVQEIAGDIVKRRGVPKVMLALVVVVAVHLGSGRLERHELHRGHQVKGPNKKQDLPELPQQESCQIKKEMVMAAIPKIIRI